MNQPKPPICLRLEDMAVKVSNTDDRSTLLQAADLIVRLSQQAELYHHIAHGQAEKVALLTQTLNSLPDDTNMCGVRQKIAESFQ